MRKIFLTILFISLISNVISADKSNNVKYEIEHEHDPMRPYLSSDKLALDTEHKYRVQRTSTLGLVAKINPSHNFRVNSHVYFLIFLFVAFL